MFKRLLNKYGIITDKRIIKQIRDEMNRPISDKAIENNKKARELLDKARGRR